METPRARGDAQSPTKLQNREVCSFRTGDFNAYSLCLEGSHLKTSCTHLHEQVLGRISNAIRAESEVSGVCFKGKITHQDMALHWMRKTAPHPSSWFSINHNFGGSLQGLQSCSCKRRMSALQKLMTVVMISPSIIQTDLIFTGSKSQSKSLVLKCSWEEWLIVVKVMLLKKKKRQTDTILL